MVSANVSPTEYKVESLHRSSFNVDGFHDSLIRSNNGLSIICVGCTHRAKVKMVRTRMQRNESKNSHVKRKA